MTTKLAKWESELDQIVKSSRKITIVRAIKYRSLISCTHTLLAIHYFNLLLRDGEEPRALEAAESLLQNDPNDAVALWFSGIVLLAGP
jgi:hypothetical protein